jgi:hypothetical protein
MAMGKRRRRLKPAQALGIDTPTRDDLAISRSSSLKRSVSGATYDLLVERDRAGSILSIESLADEAGSRPLDQQYRNLVMEGEPNGHRHTPPRTRSTS